MKLNTSNKEEHKLEEAMIKMRDIKQKAYLEGIKQGYAKALADVKQLVSSGKVSEELLLSYLEREITKLKEKKTW